MKKTKKYLAIILSMLMMICAVSQVNYNPRAAQDVYSMATPLVVGQQYNVYSGINYQLPEEYYGATVDAIFSVTVPAYSTLYLDSSVDFNDVYVVWYEKENDYETFYAGYDSMMNISAQPKTCLLVFESTDIDFSFTTYVDYAFEPDASFEPDSWLMPDFDGQVCVYGWDSELEERLQFFYEKYPEYSNYVKYINLDIYNDSIEYIEDVVNLSNSNSTTSIVAAPAHALQGFIKSGNYEAVSSIGFDVKSYMDTAYDYTEANCSFGGNLYALTWEICPNNFIYDVDIANQVLGTSDPAQVQEMIGTPEKFLQVAEVMKSAGYNMCNSYDDLYLLTTKANLGKPSGSVDATVKAFYDTLVSNKYMVGHANWIPEWYETMKDKTFFGYFGCSWFTFEEFLFDASKNVKTCRGPFDYAWDGTYLLVDNKDKSNDIANLVLETLCCDTEIMKDIMYETEDVVNNQTAVQEFIAEGNGSYSNFGGQNPYIVWDEAAKSIYQSRYVDYYNITTNGGDFDGKHYYLSDGTMVTDAFFCDGTYTYYLQADGTPMKDRLTYHPDGLHVIYFDENGHEVFSDFANVRKSISGESVDDYCFFDVNGYLYVDVVTYDKEGKNLYYANQYGVLERGKWFQFSDTVMCADGTPWNGAAGNFGYANADGTLMVNTYTYDWEGRLCYMQGNGVALY